MNPFVGTIPANTGDHPMPPAGNHPAILVAMVDLGTHEEEYQGESKGAVRKVYLVWELTTEPVNALHNHLIGKVYTLSMHKKASLRKMAEKWRGKAFDDAESFDLTKMLGKPCLVQVSHVKAQNGSDYARMEDVTNVPKGMQVPAAKRTPFTWHIDQGLPFPGDWLPFVFGQPVADKIASSQERTGRNGPVGEPGPEVNGDGDGSNEDDIPF